MHIRRNVSQVQLVSLLLRNRCDLHRHFQRRQVRTSCDHGIEGLTPVVSWVVHHEVDEDGHEKGKDIRSIAHLFAVYTAVPGRTAMHQLVSQYIEPVEDETQHLRAVAGLKRLGEGAGRGPEPLLPVLETVDPVMMLPEGIEDVAVVEQQPHWPGESLPDGLVDAAIGIERRQPLEEIQKCGPLAQRDRLKLPFVGIGGVEGDPEEDEACVVIVPASLGPADPADGTVDSQAHCFGEACSDGALLVL